MEKRVEHEMEAGGMKGSIGCEEHVHETDAKYRAVHFMLVDNLYNPVQS